MMLKAIDKSIDYLSVKDSIVRNLRVQIICGDLSPKQKLNELELASKFNVSRPPLREAFRTLESDHLISNNPRRGCSVTEMSVRDFREILSARQMLECAAVDLIEEKGKKYLPEVALTLETTARLHLPFGEDPFEKYEYLRAIAEFHFKLMESADNSRIFKFYNSIFLNLARYQSLYVYIPGLMERSQNEHEGILKSIKRGSYSKTRQLLKNHIQSFTHYVESGLEKIQQTQSKMTNISSPGS